MYTTHIELMKPIIFDQGQRSSKVTRGKTLNKVMIDFNFAHT